MKYRKKPIVIEAINIDDVSTEELTNFCGLHWTRADTQDMPMHDKEGIIVYNKAESQWLVVPIGHWIIRGIQGELYPCDPDIFEATYDPINTNKLSRQINVSHVNPNCKDPKKCKPHGETGSVEYYKKTQIKLKD